MLLRTIWRGAALAVAALAPAVARAADDADNPPGQSTFVSPDGDVAFAFTVPEHNNLDVYFSLRVSLDDAWGGVGLGSDDMKGALFLLLYRDSDTNVTFSPRVAYGNYEPEFYPDLRYEVLNGTGVRDDGYMYFNAKCIEHCRSWPARDSGSGYIDVSSPSSNAIYAVGPRERFRSSDQRASIKFHREFGGFTIDMQHTQGSADLPVLNANSKNEGVTFGWRKTGKADVKAALHGAFMVLFLVVLFPVGVAFLRLGRWARWHAVNQTVAMLGVFAGFALGVVTSFNYQRSRGFRHYHQILGFIIVAFIIGQFVLGFLHHTEYRKTQAPTKFGRIHLWLGRIIIFFGILNAFFGFSFALDNKYGMILAGIIIFIGFVMLFFVFGRGYLNKKKRTQLAANGQPGANTSYQPHPWRQDYYPAPQSSGNPSDPPPGYEPPSQHIGLQPVPARSTSPWRSADKDDDDPGLGSAQRPREFA
ncbi:hypothetical protein JDV02_006668 [Purpureocillium takamizusanense]|uniref:DOMON domain-containing protein n=1 Tax=Purpureocillium takamizusanense TaxID=2060973 RepID=A0A9Q8QKQ3_9HYPO|nr:uncharacterized protein JDV02_006668 [Purpureocillium takamizusanense]UNI20596.1 hypothetical protein JDV02_006668 [Purpureocillium takamizusanense]